MKVFSFNEWMATGGALSTTGYVSSESYSRNSWVYAAVNRIALTASSAPLIFFQGDPNTLPTFDPKERIYDKNHPVLKLFNPPKYPIILSLRDLLYRTFIHLGIDGKVFWVIDYKSGIPVAIDLRNKDALVPLYRGENREELAGWEETKTGKRLRLEAVLLIQEYKPDLGLGMSLEGLSPLAPARLSLDSDYQINGWNSSFFKTGMKTPLLLQARGMLTPDQKNDIRKEIINYYSGIDGAHGALILQGGIEVKPLSVGTKDIDFVTGKKLNREEILGVYGVPPSLVGLFEYSSYANAREQTTTFWEQTLLPKMSAILDLIQVNILDLSFPGVYAMWDTTRVAGLRPDPVTLAAPAKTYVELGYHPIQVAKILNFPDLVPDKTFDKLRKERQRQQLEFQQGLIALNPHPVVAPTDVPAPAPKKGMEATINLLAAKLHNYADWKSSGQEGDEELWDLTVRSYLQVLVAKYAPGRFDVISVFDSFMGLSSELLIKHAAEIATILVTGIYNTPQRH